MIQEIIFALKRFGYDLKWPANNPVSHHPNPVTFRNPDLATFWQKLFDTGWVNIGNWYQDEKGFLVIVLETEFKIHRDILTQYLRIFRITKPQKGKPMLQNLFEYLMGKLPDDHGYRLIWRPDSPDTLFLYEEKFWVATLYVEENKVVSGYNPHANEEDRLLIDSLLVEFNQQNKAA